MLCKGQSKESAVFPIILRRFLVIFSTTTIISFTKLNFSFGKDIKEVVEKMTKNCRKMIGKTADSLLCPLHSIQFSTLVFLPLWAKLLFLNFYSFCLKYFLDESFLKRSLPFPRKEAAISALYTFFFFVEFFLRKGPQFQLTFLINFLSKRPTYISH